MNNIQDKIAKLLALVPKIEIEGAKLQRLLKKQNLI